MEVREFHLNLEIQEDSGFVTNVRDISIKVDEGMLQEVFQVRTEEIRTVVDKCLSKYFLEEASKLRNLTSSAVSKNLLKGEYYLYFEFINKVLLPHIEKKNIATMADLYTMEKLSTLVEINLPVLIWET